MRKLPLVFVVAVLSLLTACQAARTQPPPRATQAVAAQEGLVTLRQVVNGDNYVRLGFVTPDEVRQAALGEPMAIYRVRLDALQKFTGQANPETLLVDARRSFYPVQVGKRVATSIFVTETGDGWRASELGNAAVAQLVSRYRNSPSEFIVHVQALQAYFVGRRYKESFYLTPVTDDPRTGLAAGKAVEAATVFLALQKAASAYNGLPQ